MSASSPSSPSRPPSRTGAPVRWLLGAPGLCLGVLWGFAEATLFFLVPDIIITAAALFSLRQSVRMIAAVLAGALLGGALMYGFALRSPAAAAHIVEHVPFVQQPMLDRVENDLRRSGVWALCKGPTSGIPYKVYAVRAPAYSNWLSFLLVSIPARLERLLLSWALFAAIRAWLARRIDAHRTAATAFHAIYWIAIYAYYWRVV